MSVSDAKLPTSYPHKRDGPRGFNPALAGTYSDDLALTTPPPHRHEVTQVTHEGIPAREHPLAGTSDYGSFSFSPLHSIPVASNENHACIQHKCHKFPGNSP